MIVKSVLAAIILSLSVTICGAVESANQSAAVTGIAPSEITAHLEAANWSCDRRKTCSRIASCEEAMWYLYNCSWGGKLDGDGMGKPCENLCGQDN